MNECLKHLPKEFLPLLDFWTVHFFQNTILSIEFGVCSQRRYGKILYFFTDSSLTFSRRGQNNGKDYWEVLSKERLLSWLT